jgi:hypothetical protein
VTSTERPESPAESQDRRGDLILASAGGVAAAVIGFAGMAVVGSASAFQARRLLESVLPTVRFAASAYIGGGATVLALMLTLLTFSISHDLDFRPTHYRRIRDIAALCAAVIVASVVLLMFLSFPIGEAEVDRGWYLWVYYAVLLGGSITGGAFISIVLMLFYAVRGLIEVALDPASSSLVDTD